MELSPTKITEKRTDHRREFVSRITRIPIRLYPKLIKAEINAEEEYGNPIPIADALSALAYCVRKLECIGKDIAYLPILYRCELPQIMTMKEITNRTDITFYRDLDTAVYM